MCMSRVWVRMYGTTTPSANLGDIDLWIRSMYILVHSYIYKYKTLGCLWICMYLATYVALGCLGLYSLDVFCDYAYLTLLEVLSYQDHK